MRHQITVIFGDTDAMGVVYYANYLRYFESSRAAYWRSLGRTHKDIDDARLAIPVVEAHCAYRKSARYEDVLEVDVEIGEVRGASLRFVYKVYRGSELIAEGWTRHAAVNVDDGKLRPIPEFMRNLIKPR